MVLVKWITCAVADPEAFDRGQRGWGALAGMPGFLGQCGGWSTGDPGLAQLIGCWTDAEAYAAFMAGPHDEVATGQNGTYERIEVRLFERVLDIGPGLPTDFPAGSMLRLAQCQVLPGQPEHFLEAQRRVWNPGMTAAAGMRGGLFARRGKIEFLVLSAWDSAGAHDRYRTEVFPWLQRESGAVADLAAITGDLITLEPAWTVPATD